VVTGLLKANLPCRVALRVTSRVNSGGILDTGGAETLLGKGDLLMRAGGRTLRLQAPLVTDPELRQMLGI
jgi:S-DNA-T family DNA segregation ATPase FtsK/SpoIIIE